MSVSGRTGETGGEVIPPATEQRIVDMAHWGRFLIDHGVLTETEVVTAQLLEIRDLAAGRLGGEVA